MIYGSVCSGIEAATVAWHPLGWRPAFFAEIEAFPSAVLKHHYPDVSNVGDFTRLIDAAAPVPSIDVLVGGTPCQSFSVAGLRRGLADARGGLTLEFVRLAQRLKPRWIVWENVPGVLSQDGGRAFGAFLGALGELGYGWAYRVLDAQYFGVAQRRRRVFVVGCAGGDFARAAAVLLEPESVRRDPPTRRAAREGAAAAPVTGAQGGGGGLGAGLNGGRGVATQADVAGPLDSHYYKGPGSRQGGEREYVAHVVAPPRATFWNGSDVAKTLTATSDDQRMPDQGRMQMVVQPMDSAHNGGGLNGQDAYTGRVLPVRTDTMAVRRLTPTECERLQGFPDDYTRIQWKRKPANECPDGPRYKALGNSMAVPVMRWIGERIAKVEAV